LAGVASAVNYANVGLRPNTIAPNDQARQPRRQGSSLWPLLAGPDVSTLCSDCPPVLIVPLYLFGTGILIEILLLHRRLPGLSGKDLLEFPAVVQAAQSEVLLEGHDVLIPPADLAVPEQDLLGMSPHTGDKLVTRVVRKVPNEDQLHFPDAEIPEFHRNALRLVASNLLMEMGCELGKEIAVG